MVLLEDAGAKRKEVERAMARGNNYRGKLMAAPKGVSNRLFERLLLSAVGRARVHLTLQSLINIALEFD